MTRDDIPYENNEGLKSEENIEGGIMKVMCIWLSFSILLFGCYTHTTITRDTPPPPASTEVSFRLKDGTRIVSSEYQRLENGYKVVGKPVNKENKNSKDFSGIISDEEINEVVTNEFSTGKTVLAVVLTTVILVGGWLSILDASGIYLF